MHVLKLTVLGAAIVLGGCAAPAAATPPPAMRPPSAQEARALLLEVEALARAGDLAGLCALGGTACWPTIEAVGGSPPAARPVVALNAPLREVRGPRESAAARLLVVCGQTDDGEPYATDVVVVWREGALRAIEPIYWSGLRMSTASNGRGQHEPAAPALPASCPRSP